MSYEASFHRDTEGRGFAKRVAHEIRDTAVGVARLGVFGPLLFVGAAWENSNSKHSNPFFWLPEPVQQFAMFGSATWESDRKYAQETYANRLFSGGMGVALWLGSLLGVAFRSDETIVTPRK